MEKLTIDKRYRDVDRLENKDLQKYDMVRVLWADGATTVESINTEEFYLPSKLGFDGKTMLIRKAYVIKEINGIVAKVYLRDNMDNLFFERVK